MPIFSTLSKGDPGYEDRLTNKKRGPPHRCDDRLEDFFKARSRQTSARTPIPRAGGRRAGDRRPRRPVPA